MKLKKFKKELSVAIIEDILNKSSYFSIELKKENFKRSQGNFSSTILVKAMSKKLKISDFYSKFLSKCFFCSCGV